jgi:hypothetical protein
MDQFLIPLEFSWRALIEPFFLAIFLRVFSKLFGILENEFSSCSQDLWFESLQGWRGRIFISEYLIAALLFFLLQGRDA